MTRGNPISKDGERRIRFASSATTTARSCHWRFTARCQDTKATGKPWVSRTRVSLIASFSKYGRRGQNRTGIMDLEGPGPIRWTTRPLVRWTGLEPANARLERPGARPLCLPPYKHGGGLTGLEPAFSCVTGRRGLRLLHSPVPSAEVESASSDRESEILAARRREQNWLRGSDLNRRGMAYETMLGPCSSLPRNNKSGREGWISTN